MDRRITIERATRADDGFTSAGAAEWSTLAEVWAQATPVSDREKLQSGAVGATLTYRFRVRYSSALAGITPADRVVYGGVAYNIHAVKEVGRRAGLEITAAGEA